MGEDEDWIRIEDARRYAISNYGRVMNITNNRLMHTTMRLGTRNGPSYLVTHLRHNGGYIWQYVHLLVAQAFVPNWFPGATVDHVNNDSHDNYYRNLEWVTRRENTHRRWVSTPTLIGHVS